MDGLKYSIIKMHLYEIFWIDKEIVLKYFFDFTFFIAIYFIFFYKRWSKCSKNKLIINTIMYAYIVMVIFITLMPFPIPFANGTNNLFLTNVNLIPFRDLRLNYVGAAREIILNVIMTLPFGFLYPVIKKEGVIKVTVSAFLFSLTIEVLQLLSTWWGSTRSFDVTDLITNTFGGLLGYAFFTLFKPLILKIAKD